MAAADSRLDLAERERLRHERSESGLDRHLARLPEGHPSSPRYADSTVGDDESDRDEGQRERIRPLTDAEYAEHIKDVEAKLEAARAAGLSTDYSQTIDPGREFWSDKREVIHDKLVDHFWALATAVPCEFRAIIAGGLAGSGKTTVLRDHAGFDPGRYLVINPDAIKQQLADRGLTPAVADLSPMEASALVHEESSHVAKRIAFRAQGEGKNVIWDITMSSYASTSGRIDQLRAAAYVKVEGIFVDIPVAVSMQRAEARHREGYEDFRAGQGSGGRLVAAAMIMAQADSQWGSKNRRNFEEVKHRFDLWSLYDNSVDGQVPKLIASGHPKHRGDKDDG